MSTSYCTIRKIASPQPYLSWVDLTTSLSNAVHFHRHASSTGVLPAGTFLNSNVHVMNSYDVDTNYHEKCRKIPQLLPAGAFFKNYDDDNSLLWMIRQKKINNNCIKEEIDNSTLQFENSNDYGFFYDFTDYQDRRELELPLDYSNRELHFKTSNINPIRDLYNTTNTHSKEIKIAHNKDIKTTTPNNELNTTLSTTLNTTQNKEVNTNKIVDNNKKTNVNQDQQLRRTSKTFSGLCSLSSIWEKKEPTPSSSTSLSTETTGSLTPATMNEEELVFQMDL